MKFWLKYLQVNSLKACLNVEFNEIWLKISLNSYFQWFLNLSNHFRWQITYNNQRKYGAWNQVFRSWWFEIYQLPFTQQKSLTWIFLQMRLELQLFDFWTVLLFYSAPFFSEMLKKAIYQQNRYKAVPLHFIFSFANNLAIVFNRHAIFFNKSKIWFQLLAFFIQTNKQTKKNIINISQNKYVKWRWCHNKKQT